MVDAVLGSKVKVPTLDSDAEVDVPAGTQPDSVLGLNGKGLPYFGSNAKGDLLMRIEVQVLYILSRKEREVNEELRRSNPPSQSEKRVFSKS